MKKIPLNLKGLTLLEVLIAMLIATLAFAAVGSFLDSGNWLVKDNRSHIYAFNALREEMEVLRNTSFDTIAGYGTSSTFTNAQFLKLKDGVSSRTIADAFGSDIKKVTLSVSWTSRSGRTLTENVTTYVSRTGLSAK